MTTDNTEKGGRFPESCEDQMWSDMDRDSEEDLLDMCIQATTHAIARDPGREDEDKAWADL